LHLYAELSLNLDGIQENLHNKLCIVQFDKNGKPEFEGGKISEGRIKTKIREFGSYSIEADSTPPILRPINVTKNANMRGHKSLRFSVTDDLSGVATYKAYIDKEWVLLEYDPKSNLLYYEFDKNRLKESINHELEIYLTDNMNNQNFYHTTFYW
jgi:hypothetical protein